MSPLAIATIRSCAGRVAFGFIYLLVFGALNKPLTSPMNILFPLVSIDFLSGHSLTWFSRFLQIVKLLFISPCRHANAVQFNLVFL